MIGVLSPTRTPRGSSNSSSHSNAAPLQLLLQSLWMLVNARRRPLTLSRLVWPMLCRPRCECGPRVDCFRPAHSTRYLFVSPYDFIWSIERRTGDERYAGSVSVWMFLFCESCPLIARHVCLRFTPLRFCYTVDEQPVVAQARYHHHLVSRLSTTLCRIVFVALWHFFSLKSCTDIDCPAPHWPQQVAMPEPI